MHQQALSNIFLFLPPAVGFLENTSQIQHTWHPYRLARRRDGEKMPTAKGMPVASSIQRQGTRRQATPCNWAITCTICIRCRASGALDFPLLFNLLLSIVVLSSQCRERSSKVLGGGRLSHLLGLGLGRLLDLSRRTGLVGLLSRFD